eukprot:697288-Rhodomonas_salina.1
MCIRDSTIRLLSTAHSVGISVPHQYASIGQLSTAHIATRRGAGTTSGLRTAACTGGTAAVVPRATV